MVAVLYAERQKEGALKAPLSHARNDAERQMNERSTNLGQPSRSPGWALPGQLEPRTRPSRLAPIAQSQIRPSPMAPHSDPQQTFEARRVAATERLLKDGIPPSWVCLAVASYETDFTHMPHLARAPDFWDRAYDYIARQHPAPGRPQAMDVAIHPAGGGPSVRLPASSHQH
jgi:hypothetical protein